MATPVRFVPLATLHQTRVGQLAPGGSIAPSTPVAPQTLPIGILETSEQQQRLLNRLPYSDALRQITPALVITGITIGIASGIGSTVGTAVGTMIVDWFRARPRRA